MTAHVAAPMTEASQPRARGGVRLTAKARAGMSVIDDLSMSGSMKLLFPRPSGKALDAMLINTAGGVTGGDRFFIEAEAGADTQITLTTQAAERGYAVRGDLAGRVDTHLTARARARINWLPQETILFNAMNFERRLRVDLAPDATFFMVEALILGRRAMGEVIRAGRFRDRVEISRDGTPIYIDAVALTGDVGKHMASRATMNGGCAMAAVVLAAPEAEGRLDAVRGLLPETAGASLLSPNLLAIRIVAEDGFELRKTLVPLIRLLNDDIPRPWML